MLSNLLASLASFHTRSPRCSLVLRCPPRLLCRLASLAALLASADLRSRFARACRLACLACFARLADCSLRSIRLSRCSLCSSSLPLPSLASLGPLLLFARSARCRRLLCSRFARQLACCSLRSPPRLRLASLAAGCSACCSLLVRRLPARSARPSHSPCPLRLLSIFTACIHWTGRICGIDVTDEA